MEALLMVKGNVNVNGSEEKKLPWQEAFRIQLSEIGNEEAIRIWQELDEADALKGEITEEKVQELQHKVKYSSVPAELKKGFERKLKLLDNRVERSISENFGSLIKHLREGKGYSLKDMEQLTGISSSYINRIENSQRKAPSYKMIEKLATALGQEVSDLLNVANAEQPEELTNVEELLVASTFMINDVRATKDSKELLVAIIEKINKSTWGEDKYKDGMELMDAIERYRNSLNKKKN